MPDLLDNPNFFLELEKVDFFIPSSYGKPFDITRWRIKILGELYLYTDNDLLGIRTFGRTSLRLIKFQLGHLGLPDREEVNLFNTTEREKIRDIENLDERKLALKNYILRSYLESFVQNSQTATSKNMPDLPIRCVNAALPKQIKGRLSGDFIRSVTKCDAVKAAIIKAVVDEVGRKLTL